MRLLLIEADAELRRTLVGLLREHGYGVQAPAAGEKGFEMAAAGNYDLLAMDQKLPGWDGVWVIQEIRRIGLDMPILLLSADDTPQDRIRGLDAGADDYLVKPFLLEEFLARLRVLVRRCLKDGNGSKLSGAGLVLDPLKCQVTRGSEVIKLSHKETLLLETLLRNRGQVITKESIFEKVWGYNSEAEFANIDLYIHYLRKKLPTAGIKTIRGVGYIIG